MSLFFSLDDVKNFRVHGFQIVVTGFRPRDAWFQFRVRVRVRGILNTRRRSNRRSLFVEQRKNRAKESSNVSLCVKRMLRVLKEKREAMGGYDDDWKRRHHGQSAKKSNHKKKKENVAPNSLVFARHRSTLCALLFVTRLQSLCCFLLLLLRFTSRICAASFLITCRINLSPFDGDETLFPSKKGGEISKGELFRAKSESTARHVCFSRF